MVVMTEKTRQYYKVSKKYRDQQREIEMWKCFQADPSLKYWLALGGGVLVTALLTAINNSGKKETEMSDQEKLEAIAKRGAFDYAALMAGGGIGLGLSEIVQAFDDKAKENPMGTLIGMTATWTGLNAVCLVLSASSGNKDGAGILGTLVTTVG